MRIRTIKPEFWQNEFVSQLPDFAQLLAIGLLNYADDEGYFNAHPGLIKSALFPLRDVSVMLHGAITELSRIGFVKLYKGSDGRSYGHVVNFLKHQVINRPKPSVIKPLCISPAPITEESRRNHGGITEAAVTPPARITEESRSHHEPVTAGMEGNGREGNIYAEPEPRPATQGASERFLFEKLAIIEGIPDPAKATTGEAAKVQHALRAILAVDPNVTPWEIEARAKRYPEVMPTKCKLTAHGLAANWGKCGPKEGGGQEMQMQLEGPPGWFGWYEPEFAKLPDDAPGFSQLAAAHQNRAFHMLPQSWQKKAWAKCGKAKTG